MFQKTTMAAAIAISTSLLLVACGGSNGDNNGAVVGSGSTTSTGALLTGASAPKTTLPSKTAAEFAGLLSSSPEGAQFLSLTTGGTNTLPCGVAISHIEYTTLGAANEETTGSGAVMVPTGSDPACTGKRPVVLYAHGTTTSKGFNMADLANPASKGEASIVAATFAAQGYIVIAPNYAGYDTSALAYHPYVNYKQQSQEMIDALKAGRKALESSTVAVGSVDSGKLFVTGYSEGGYVAMATLKAMDAANIPVTAGAPMSGPYALAAYGDVVFGGTTPIGGPVFAPLLTTGYQMAYGNVYTKTSDGYAPQFADMIDSALSASTGSSILNIFTASWPQLSLFQSAPTGNAVVDGFSAANPSPTPFGFAPSGYLINTNYRAAYLADAGQNPDGLLAGPTNSNYPNAAVAPANGLRKDLKLNDLRGYIPSMPVLMCGGNNDPTVFFTPNAKPMAGIMGAVAASGAPVKFALLDIDATNPQNPAIPVDPKANVSIPFDPTKGGANTLGAAVNAVMVPAVNQLQGQFASVLGSTAANASTAPNTAPAYNAIYSQTGSVALATKFAVATQYHGALVLPFCTIAARTFFQQY